MSGDAPSGRPVRPVGEDDLHAWIDGRLDPARRTAVEQFMRDNPDRAATLEADRVIRDALRAQLRFKADEAVPARLRASAILARRRIVFGSRLRAVAAAIAWLAVGLAAGWAGRGVTGAGLTPGRDAEAIEAMAAHRVFVVERVHPVEVAAAQEAHLVQWLSRRVGQPLVVPNLAAQGFQLVGGRVLPAGATAAAQLMYEDTTGNRLTLYMRSADPSGETAFRFVRDAGLSAFSWTDRGLGYAMVATADRQRLLSLAENVYRQVDPGAHVPADNL